MGQYPLYLLRLLRTKGRVAQGELHREHRVAHMVAPAFAKRALRGASKDQIAAVHSYMDSRPVRKILVAR
jgi:hypothetical protein